MEICTSAPVKIECVENKKMPYLYYVNYFRAIAIIQVVAGHSLVWGQGKVKQFFSYLFDGGTYPFVFISGFLFYYLSSNFSYGTYLKKKFFNVFLPFIFTSLPGLIAFIFSQSSTASIPADDYVRKALISFVWPKGINPPTWYIGMIAIFFFLAPVFLSLWKKRTLWWILFISSFCFAVFYPRYWPNVSKMTFSQTIHEYGLFYIKISMHFLFTYLLGMQMCSVLIAQNEQFSIKNMALITFVSWVLVGLYVIFIKNASCPWNTFLFLTKICLIFAILYYLKNNEQKIKLKLWLHKTLNLIAEYSFGIFFFHFIIRDIILKKSLFSSSTPNILNLYSNSWRCFGNALFLFCCMLGGGDFISVCF